MTERCTAACVADQKCTTCGRRKAPVGRDVAAEIHDSYCTRDCAGYRLDPKPGHLWPGELDVE